jgi:hypothetical protein
LFHLKYRHIKAGSGGDGSGDRSTGADGEDKFIEVPLGTVVRDKETGEVLFEITEDGEKQVLSRGKGGLGNWHFRVLQTKLKICSTWFTRIRDGCNSGAKSFSRCRFSRLSKCWKINIIVCSDIS